MPIPDKKLLNRKQLRQPYRWRRCNLIVVFFSPDFLCLCVQSCFDPISIFPYYYLHYLCSTSFVMSLASRCAGSWAVFTFLCSTGRRGSLLSATSPTTTLRPWAFTMGGVFRFYHKHNITRQVCVAKTTQSISPCLGFHDGLHNHQHDQTKVCDLFFRP